MKILVGLGNPGQKYSNTRHNVGFMVIDRLARQLGMECTQRKFQALFCKKTVKEEELVLLKPQTFMNLSGIAVKEVVDMYKCLPQDVMAVCDDLDLPPGKLRVRRSGGSGGHRGLESIAAKLGTRNFSRLKIGIGRPAVGDPGDYVLSAFLQQEESAISEAIENACLALQTWLFDGIDVCMNTFNA